MTIDKCIIIKLQSHFAKGAPSCIVAFSSVTTTVRYLSKNWQPESQFWILQRQEECIIQFLLPSHLLLKMHGCCPNEVCRENLSIYLASLRSIVHKASVLRKLAINCYFFILSFLWLKPFFKHRIIILCSIACTVKDANPSMEYPKSSREIFFEHQNRWHNW